MPENRVLLERQDEGVAVVVINNPQNRNALDLKTRHQLERVLAEVQQDGQIRAVVLTGRGEHFSAGADIKAWRDFTASETRQRTQAMHQPMRRIIQMEKPVMAMVRGYAVGGGLNLALACDMIFAADNASFGQTFMKVGLLPDVGGMCFLPLNIGLPRAKELMFSGEIISAAQAHELGFVNRLYPLDRLEDETLAFARRLAQGPPLALGLTKRILNATFLHSLEQVLEMELQAQALCVLSEDHKEGRNAFLKKRRPKFKGD